MAIVRAPDSPPTALTREQVDLIKTTIARGATDDELALFVQTCNRLSLDPFARQIYLVKRWDSTLRCEVAQSQVSIDGFRLVAERTREYRGQTVPQWCGPDGVWVDVWLANEPPAAARVGVHREGFAEPMIRVARYSSYVQLTKERRPNRTWQTMPEVMLSKCAEALALRAAFPHELSGVYSAEEMGRADNDEREQPAAREEPPAKRLPAEASPRMTAAKVVEQLKAKLTAMNPPDRELLASFYEDARAELALCAANEQQRMMVQEAFGKRCADIGIKPKDVLAGRAA